MILKKESIEQQFLKKMLHNKNSWKWVSKYKIFVVENKKMNQKEIDKMFDVSSKIRKRKISILYNEYHKK